jgi:ubiquinone/menaquinone biosynthesis C-methylase UbiE
MTPAPLTRGRTLDHVACVYDVLSPLMLFGQEGRMARPCLSYLQDRRIRSVLDIGCGTGTLTIEIARLLAERGGRVMGIDAAAKMIAVARRKAGGTSNVRFEVAAAEALPFPDASFDWVLSTFFFHHVDYELKMLSLNEAFRVLKPEGVFVIMDVDTPTNVFGKICAWAGYYLFNQEEIRENIEGKLRLAMEQSCFRHYEKTAHHQGYISTFNLRKPGDVR